MRLGEVLPLGREDFDGETLKVRRTAHEGTILAGTKTDHGEQTAGRIVPVPATLAWMIEAQIQINGEDCELLFPTPSGRLWRQRNFYRDVWRPAQERSGIDIRPHKCRHSYVTYLRAAGTMPTSRDRRPSRRDDASALHASRRRGFNVVRAAIG